jgi:hypothetical protein
MVAPWSDRLRRRSDTGNYRFSGQRRKISEKVQRSACQLLTGGQVPKGILCARLVTSAQAMSYAIAAAWLGSPSGVTLESF